MDEWCTSSESGVTSTARGLVVGGLVGGSVVGSTRGGVPGRFAGEARVGGGLDVEVSGRETQTLANRFEGEFRVVFQGGVKGISSGKLDSNVMDVMLENNKSR